MGSRPLQCLPPHKKFNKLGPDPCDRPKDWPLNTFHARPDEQDDCDGDQHSKSDGDGVKATPMFAPSSEEKRPAEPIILKRMKGTREGGSAPIVLDRPDGTHPAGLESTPEAPEPVEASPAAERAEPVQPRSSRLRHGSSSVKPHHA